MEGRHKPRRFRRGGMRFKWWWVWSRTPMPLALPSTEPLFLPVSSSVEALTCTDRPAMRRSNRAGYRCPFLKTQEAGQRDPGLIEKAREIEGNLTHGPHE
jgi:hypothetical protein